MVTGRSRSTVRRCGPGVMPRGGKQLFSSRKITQHITRTRTKRAKATSTANPPYSLNAANMVNYSAALTAVLAAAASVGGADAGLAPRGGIFGLSRRAAGSAAGKSPFGLTTRLATTGGDVAANIPLSIPRGGSPAVIGETDEDRPIDASELYLPGLVGATVAKKTVRAVLHQYRIEISVVLRN